MSDHDDDNPAPPSAAPRTHRDASRGTVREVLVFPTWREGSSYAARAEDAAWLHRCGGFSGYAPARTAVFQMLERIRHGLICDACGTFVGVDPETTWTVGTVWAHACDSGGGYVGHVLIGSPGAGVVVLRCRRCGAGELGRLAEASSD